MLQIGLTYEFQKACAQGDLDVHPVAHRADIQVDVLRMEYIIGSFPVQMYLAKDAEHDSQILKRMYHDLPSESSLFGDSGYTNYELEDMFKEAEQVDLQINRKSNLRRKDIAAVAFIKEHMRKRIETSISQICALM